jgi:hypothetical protein
LTAAGSHGNAAFHFPFWRKDMSKMTYRPRVEALEARTTPSATGLPPLAGILAVPGHVTHPPATGLLNGNYTSPMPIPDVGKVYMLTGTGVVAGLGKVSVGGSLHALGFTPTGQAGGTLTLANTLGTLTFALTGPTQPGFAALPTRFTTTITGATGKYKNLRGTGTALLHLEPFLYPALCLPAPRGCHPFPDAGTFTLRLT